MLTKYIVATVSTNKDSSTKTPSIPIFTVDHMGRHIAIVGMIETIDLTTLTNRRTAKIHVSPIRHQGEDRLTLNDTGREPPPRKGGAEAAVARWDPRSAGGAANNDQRSP